MPLRAYAAGARPGEPVGFNVKVYEKGKLIADSQPAAPFRRDATATIRLMGFKPVKKKTYVVRVEANIFSGGGKILTRTFTVVGV